MFYKVVNGFDADMLLEALEDGFVSDIKSMPADYRKACSQANQSLNEQIMRFDEFYDKYRNPDRDLGGFAYFLPTIEDAERFLDKIKEWHHITDMPSEYEDIVAEYHDVEFVEELFILSSDFGLVILYPRRKN